MNRLFRLFFFNLLLSIATLPTSLANPTPAATVAVDEEYDRYKKRGDDFFKQGKYGDARRQYLLCLDVPGFENDAYAKGQIDKCTTGQNLRQKADDALQQGRGGDAIELYGQLLTLNPDDAATKLQLADYYERDGNRLFNLKQYVAAKDRYNRALPYTTTRQESIGLQLKAIENALYAPPPKRVGLKLVTGTVAVGAGVYALLLRNDFQSKLNTLNQVEQTTDPDGDNVINTDRQKQEYDVAYKAAEAAQQKNGLFKACLGFAAVATIAEVYLLVRKPKAKLRTNAIRWQPSSDSWGLALRYDF